LALKIANFIANPHQPLNKTKDKLPLAFQKQSQFWRRTRAFAYDLSPSHRTLWPALAFYTATMARATGISAVDGRGGCVVCRKQLRARAFRRSPKTMTRATGSALVGLIPTAGSISASGGANMIPGRQDRLASTAAISVIWVRQPFRKERETVSDPTSAAASEWLNNGV